MGRGKIAALVVGVVVAGSALGAGVIVIVNGGFSMKGSSETAADKYFDQKDAEASSEAAAASTSVAKFDEAEQAVIGACESAVRSQLISPSTAQFTLAQYPEAGLNLDRAKWTIDGHMNGMVDSQNEFGAMVRSDWWCVIAPNSSAATPKVTITSLDPHHG